MSFPRSKRSGGLRGRPATSNYTSACRSPFILLDFCCLTLRFHGTSKQCFTWKTLYAAGTAAVSSLEVLLNTHDKDSQGSRQRRTHIVDAVELHGFRMQTQAGSTRTPAEPAEGRDRQAGSRLTMHQRDLWELQCTGVPLRRSCARSTRRGSFGPY